MGDRISIQFVKDSMESVVFFSHWDGEELIHAVDNYIFRNQKRLSGGMNPINRRQPDTVMVDFISQYLRGQKIDHNYYLGRTANDGDNSDNGHWIYDLSEENWKPNQRGEQDETD